MKALVAGAVLALVAVQPAPALGQKLAPCGAKKMFDRMPIPVTQPVATVAGHEFRKGDICVPVEIGAEWKTRYDASDHEWYEMTARETYPGELWYRTDTEEFVIVANGKTYSGPDVLLSLSAAGEACNSSSGDRCGKWTRFGNESVVSQDVLGSKTGSFVYGDPAVITPDEEIPPAVDIMPPAFEFHRNEREYFRPPMPTVDNVALFDRAPLTYRELVRASSRREQVSRTIAWNRNERADEPGEHVGTLTLHISFEPSCPGGFRIVAPDANARLVFSEESPGTVTIEAHVGEVMDMPPELVERISWSAPEKAGSEISYDPPSRQGPDVRITYSGLPAGNDDFGPTTITASVDTGGSCGALSASQTVLLFFPRDARNNPAGDAPNYVFYWLQTAAGQGAVRDQDVRYVHRDFECGENPRWLGYHPRDTVLSVPADPQSQPLLVGRDYVYLCDMHKYDNLYVARPSTNFYMEGVIDENLSWEGIDTFAVTLLHELAHRQHWRDWWNTTRGYPKGGFYDDNNNRQRDADEPMLDADGDFILDTREAGLGYDTGVKYTFGPVGSGLGIDMYDEHHLTYSIAEKWPKGAADRQDWAKPGKQWR